ncbi:guanylyl cyclase C [Eucyclogobius newberryi]|uniref:guanylyl cyclase C n=1 Tax=Eucyclogobius newberryi TaxID=166745 RepID=UPI003B5B59C4
MAPGGIWLSVCTLWILLAQSSSIKPCLDGVMINVILLNDTEFPWSLQYVQGEILRAIETNANINAANGLNFSLNTNFNGFDTRHYNKTGCDSSVCEAVAEFYKLKENDQLGCAVLGPTCTYATFTMVNTDKGLNTRTPFLSAGSFGLSCDGTSNLLRLLPPARKISSFFTEFWHYQNKFKPVWEKAYVYKKQKNTEDCFWYINALDTDGQEFAKNISKKAIRRPEELKYEIALANRTSNVFIMCGSPADVEEAKRGIPEADNSDILFFLIDLYNDEYYINTTSRPHMRNVLVLTMPNTRHYNISRAPENKMNDYMAAYHDAVLFIGEVIRKIVQQPDSERRVDPFVSASLFRNTSFNGTAGKYRLDEQGDRDETFSIIYTTDNKYKSLFTFDTETFYTDVLQNDPVFIWGKRLPNDSPDRGPEIEDVIVTVLAVTVVVVATIAFIFYRQSRKERKQRKRWSHINLNLVSLLEDNQHTVVSLKIENESKQKQFNIIRAIYDKKIVILKELKHSDGDFDEMQRIELNALLHIDYNNLTKFYGTVKLDQGVFGVFEYAERGSLKYVLNDKVSYPEETFMDWEFKISVMYDIAKGMSYLHASDLQVHGRLKSKNCVVDNRMVVKITDFGCNKLLIPGRDLWTAPEHLRKQGTSQKGDVYSFAIIAQEIVYRRNTFYTECCSDRAEKLSRVQCPGVTVFRPDLNFDNESERELEMFMLIKSCWDEDPERRPDFKKVENCLEKRISEIHNHDNESYLDNMIRRLQMYSRNLEHLVEERTALYKNERDRADYLNYMLLPGPVVKSLKESGVVEPELYEEVTIYFSDIVGFTTLCQYSTPMDVVDMLNDIYKSFDNIVDHHDVYKVETIGDAYMVASGLPKRNGNRHAVDICHMALDILAYMETFQLRHLPGIPLWIRIGVHTGPCAAGVVGVKMPRYCLFGDTVNTASRMESSGHPLKIHVSQPTIDILKRTDCEFEYEYRGETFLKGKGTETTYWLTGEKGKNFDLPTPPTAENFQRLQQDLAHMIVECLDRRSRGSIKRKPLLSQSSAVSQEERELCCVSEEPEYLHLATVDNTLSTFL